MSAWTEEEMNYIAREAERAAREDQPRVEMPVENFGQMQYNVLAREAELRRAEHATDVPEPNQYTTTASAGQLTREALEEATTRFVGGVTGATIGTTADYGSLLDQAMRQSLYGGYASSTWSQMGIKSKTIKMRGFEVVNELHRKYPFSDVMLPSRAESRSAGYDFYSPIDYTLAPYEKYTIWTDVKAYMRDDEVLNIYIRSSMAIKHGVQLANAVGVIDASYYENESNDGNIGICLFNHSEQPVYIRAGDRIAQGVFQTYLIADEDNAQHAERVGGFGSTGR
jgi:dUTP pyrophosphatase